MEKFDPQDLRMLTEAGLPLWAAIAFAVKALNAPPDYTDDEWRELLEWYVAQVNTPSPSGQLH